MNEDEGRKEGRKEDEGRNGRTMKEDEGRNGRKEGRTEGR